MRGSSPHRVHTTNGTSIGSAVFARFAAVSNFFWFFVVFFESTTTFLCRTRAEVNEEPESLKHADRHTDHARVVHGSTLCDPIRPNPWVNPTRGQLWTTLRV